MVAVAAAGFLLAVLWFDLMFDVQAWRTNEGRVADDALTSISTYYRRVTTDASPMNRLVAVVMFTLLVALIVELADDATAVAWITLALAVSAIGLAGARVVRRAKQLGSGQIATEDRSRIARAILFDHVVCFAAIAILIVLQVSAA